MIQSSSIRPLWFRQPNSAYRKTKIWIFSVGWLWKTLYVIRLMKPTRRHKYFVQLINTVKSGVLKILQLADAAQSTSAVQPFSLVSCMYLERIALAYLNNTKLCFDKIFWTNFMLISALFWDITQRRVVILYRSFGITHRSNFQGLLDPWR
jgi:hypothetical protein